MMHKRAPCVLAVASTSSMRLAWAEMTTDRREDEITTEDVERIVL